MTSTQWAGVGLILAGGAAVVAGELVGVFTEGQTITGWTTAHPLVLTGVLAGLAVLAWHFVSDYFQRHNR